MHVDCGSMELQNASHFVFGKERGFWIGCNDFSHKKMWSEGVGEQQRRWTLNHRAKLCSVIIKTSGRLVTTATYQNRIHMCLNESEKSKIR